MLWSKRRFAAAAMLSIVASNVQAAPSAANPAAGQIEAFDRALLSAMKLSEGRAAALLSTVEQTFNFPVMARFVIGLSWAQMSDTDHAALIAALKRYTTARIAYEFDHFANQKFIIDPAVQSRGPDRLVKAQFLEPGDSPVHIVYRMREYEGLWKVIDVYSDGVSILTTERADLSSTLEAGGPAAVATKLQQAADRFTKQPRERVPSTGPKVPAEK